MLASFPDPYSTLISTNVQLGESTALIDADVLAYKAACVCSQSGLQEVQNVVVSLVRSWVAGSMCLGWVLALSGARTQYHRTKVYPEYKAKRAILPPPRYLHQIRAFLRTMPHLWALEHEADDLLAGHAVRSGAVIVTVDKDLLQVPGRHYNPDKDQHCVVDPDQADYNHHLQWLVGDSTDNYPGLPGIGPVKAEALLEGSVLGSRSDIVFRAYKDRGYNADFCLTQYVCATILHKHLVFPGTQVPQLQEWRYPRQDAKNKDYLLDSPQG